MTSLIEDLYTPWEPWDTVQLNATREFWNTWWQNMTYFKLDTTTSMHSTAGKNNEYGTP